MRKEVPYITTAGRTGYLDADKIIAIEPGPSNTFTNVIFEGGYEMAISGLIDPLVGLVRIAITGEAQGATKSFTTISGSGRTR